MKGERCVAYAGGLQSCGPSVTPRELQLHLLVSNAWRMASLTVRMLAASTDAGQAT